MKIYAIEGLGGEIGAWLRKPLREMGFDVTWYPWWWTPKLPQGCILMGHSFGAAKAIRLSKECNPKLLITFDPRLEPADGFKVDCRALNFYRKGFMQGYSVAGSLSLVQTGIGHTQLPRYCLKIYRDEICSALKDVEKISHKVTSDTGEEPDLSERPF